MQLLPDLHVVAAVMERDGAALVARRPSHDPLAGCWEFPGGKVEAGETLETALQRELFEELGITVRVTSRLGATAIRQPRRWLTLHFLGCEPTGTTAPAASAHDEVAWVRRADLAALPFAEADRPMVAALTGENRVPRLAFAITPHGLGHAGRAAAVMAALQAAAPAARFDIHTTAPPRFFAESGISRFLCHDDALDVGFVQRTPFEVDYGASVACLERFIAHFGDEAERLAERLRRAAAAALVADVSPLGLAAAQLAGCPGVLVENFTWDWIYEGFLEEEPRLAPFVAHMRTWQQAASLRIQTAPAGVEIPGAVHTGPVGRRSGRAAAATRCDLGIEPDRLLVLLTISGGVGGAVLEAAARQLPDATVLVPNAPVSAPTSDGNLLLLPAGSVYHPDLVAASDAVVCKMGYSTFAEAALAGKPLAFFRRRLFRESAVLEAYAARRLTSLALPDDLLEGRGDWCAALRQLLAAPRAAAVPDGAPEAASAILRAITSQA